MMKKIIGTVLVGAMIYVPFNLHQEQKEVEMFKPTSEMIQADIREAQEMSINESIKGELSHSWYEIVEAKASLKKHIADKTRFEITLHLLNEQATEENMSEFVVEQLGTLTEGTEVAVSFTNGNSVVYSY